MKRRTLEVSICIFVVLALNSSFVSGKIIEHTGESLDDSVPVWNVGDRWTYTIDSVKIDWIYNGQRIYFKGSINDAELTVSDTSGSSYTCHLTGKINGYYKIFLKSSISKVYVIGNLSDKLIKLDGTVTFGKSDLQIIDASLHLTGISFAKIAPLPIYLPMPFKVTADIDLSKPFPILNFPLSEGDYWDMPNFVAKAGIHLSGPFGFIDIPLTVSREFPWVPFAFHCGDKEYVDVEAGIYEAYKITVDLFGEGMTCYYSPEVGNIIKIDAVLTNGQISAELKDTSYAK